jgi:DNA-binding NtrC family response regulator
MRKVLVVDDEAAMRTALAISFRRRGWQVDTAAGAGEALAKFRSLRPPLVITDVRMPDGDGLEVSRAVRDLAPDTAVILLTAFGNVPEAVRAVQQGACDYLVKPVCFEQLEEAAGRALARHQAAGTATGMVVGRSAVMAQVMERANRAARSQADVLIEAESGTGKELLARLIHERSPRAQRPFVAVNCAAFPETLLESELFGHVKGAFTGAVTARPGRFEQADGGTLLLDEIGEMPLSLQPKLLRVLQEREFYRLGDTRPLRVDLRVIATTNRPLRLLVEEGRFRSDLYYRLNVIPLTLPPLRERRDDIAELAEFFLRRFSGEERKLSPDMLARFERYPWPGNVRELANVIRRVVALGSDAQADLIPDLNPVLPGKTDSALATGQSLRELERQLLVQTLEATGGNRSRTAEILGISLRTVRNKIREHGLPPRRMYAGH